MAVTLTVTAGPHAGRTFAFDRHDTFLVGRAKDAHFQLSYDDPYFSRRHFLVEVNPPRVRVIDFKSRNGIKVNGARVTHAELKDGDELQAGHTTFRLSVPAADPDSQETLDAPRASAPPGLVSTAAPTPPAGLLSTMALGPAIPGYALETELGRGAMGVVYRATRQSDGAAVAVKVITPVDGVAEREKQKFLREAAIMTELDHRCVVRCFDRGAIGAHLYIAMELLEGPDLKQRVKDRGPLDVTPAVRLMVHVLDGLAYAHARGFVHRDVKPANVLMCGPKKARAAKVADFGLARAYDTCGLSGLTMQGEMGGTPAFMPPEQVTHYRDVKPAADQYSAAATLYFLLTAQFVLDYEKEQTAQMIQIVQDARVPLRARRPDLPAELEVIVMKALSLDPDKRFPNVAALKDALRPWV
jgi:eukaryotic-like serine/threonine-protein kinase